MKVPDTIELKAVFGMMYFRGLLGSNHNSVESWFCNTQCHYVFSTVMSKNFFKFLLSHLTFDDHQQGKEKGKFDPSADIITVWERFDDNLGKYLTPSEYLSLDETLYLMLYQIVFRQYNPKNLHHYELLFKSLNDVYYPYTYKSIFLKARK